MAYGTSRPSPDIWRGEREAGPDGLGHSSAAITLRVYAHLWSGDDERTRSVMDSALPRLADRVRTKEVV
jgi:hypothetical protein